MQRGWGSWSPFEHEVRGLPTAWEKYPAEQQCVERPYDYLPDLNLVLEVARRTGGPVLDLACGTGRVALALGRAGYDVVGLDFNPAFIQRAQAEASRASDLAGSVRFEVADARCFELPERFGLIVMMDQAFKYLLHHDDHLDCLHAIRRHLRDDGRFLVEHRCLFKLPDAGPGETYTYAWNGEEWAGVDEYDPILQVGVTASQPLDRPDAAPMLDPCRDFTYQELSLLHRVVGFELEESVNDLDERSATTPYFDAALVLKKAPAWRPQSER
ncbi:MAG: SAM-dependent methyltransferase [Armatimonadetes bacterium]|jgi:SAM-dependent methyltransferase|nr:SAM-dependent methyltransferase [Armatimonadota bacterium]